VQLVRELADRSALVPDFTKQKELVDAYSARWRNLAEEMGAITFSARPQWRVIMGLGTNDILEGGIVLHPIFGFPILPATSLKGVSRAYAQWVLERPGTASARIGYFGASTGAGAALVAAASDDFAVAAVVSRGGRPDLAEGRLEEVTAPTLLLVGSEDVAVLEFNRQALAHLAPPSRLVVVEGAGHLFEEPGALAEVAIMARDWFNRYLMDDVVSGRPGTSTG